MRVLALSMVALSALVAIPALAQSEDEEILDTVPVNDEGTDRAPPPDEEKSVTYSGIGLSKVSTEFENLDDAVNLDFGLGIRVPTITWISAEINLSFTIVPGENKGQENCTQSGGGLLGGGTVNCPENQTASRNDLQMNNVGVFAVLRSPGRFYAMGKGGYRYINSSIEEIQDGDDKSGSAWAAGGGWRWGRGLSGIELAYTQYSSQLEYIGFNIAYGFGGRGAP